MVHNEEYKNSKKRIMSRQHHYLKTETEYYQAVERGEKSLNYETMTGTSKSMI